MYRQYNAHAIDAPHAPNNKIRKLIEATFKGVSFAKPNTHSAGAGNKNTGIMITEKLKSIK